MKQLVNAFVVVLVLTGAVASTQISYASSQNKVAAAKAGSFEFDLGGDRRAGRLSGSETLDIAPTPSDWEVFTAVTGVATTRGPPGPASSDFSAAINSCADWYRAAGRLATMRPKISCTAGGMSGRKEDKCGMAAC